jgi:hypothetical protein
MAQNGAQPIFSELLKTLTVGKSSPKCRLGTLEFKKLPKVNNHPLGENSHNSAIFPYFRRKNWRFSRKTMLWSIFWHKLAIFLVKKTPIF